MPKKEPTKYDPLVLSNMVEPILLYVERNEHGKSEPIPIPALFDDGKINPDGTPGHNWSRDAVAKLQWWLRDFWVGGGSYYAKAQDNVGKLMDWEFVIPPRDTPPRQAPALVSAGSVPPPTTAQAMPSGQMQGLVQMGGSPQMVQPGQYQPPPQLPAQPTQMGQFQPHLSTPASVQQPVANQPYQMGYQQPQQQMAQQTQPQQQMGYQQPQAPQQQYQQPQYQGGWQNPAPPSWNQPSWRDEAPAPRRDYAREREMEEKAKAMEERAKVLEAQIQASQLAQLKAEYDAKIERQRQEEARKFDQLKAEIHQAGESTKKGDDEETKALRQQIERQKADFDQMKLNVLQEQMKSQQEAMAAQLKATQEAMKQLAEGGGGRRDDDRFKTLEMQLQSEREENRRRQEELLRERAAEKQARDLEREREKQDRDIERMRSEMKEQQARSEAMMKDLAASVKESTTSRPDPILEVMRENQRTAMEHQRQLADMQKLQIEKMSAMQLSPIDLFRLLKEQGSGNDGVFKTLMTSVGDIAGMYKNVAEHAIGLAGGGSNNSSMVADMVGLGVNTVKEMADRYFQMKAATGVADGKARQAEAMAKAQEAAAAAQGQQAYVAAHQAQAAAQQAQAERARMNAEAIRAATAQQGGGLSGAAEAPAPAAGNGSSGTPQQQPVPRVVQTATAPAPSIPTATAPEPAARPTDEQFFGGITELLEAVGHLREGVKSGNLDPENAVKVMLLGAGQLAQAKISCVAFQIFEDERWADFIDIMLPAAPKEFQEECVNILARDVGGEDDDDDTAAEAAPASPTNETTAEV